MTNINVVTLTGRLTKDVEIRETPASKLALFTLAFNTWDYNPESKQKEDKANYIDCKLWGKGIDKLATSLKKGTQVCIMGDLHQEKWSNDNGNHTKHTITIRTINLGGNKRTSDESNESTNTEVGNDFIAEFNGKDIPF